MNPVELSFGLGSIKPGREIFSIKEWYKHE
jgi:hypothetical protein